MSFLLKITAGKNTGSEYTLQEGKNLIGRSRSASVRVFNEDVSGKHFSIEVADGVATLGNLSSYGTRVDGILVHESVELHSGQVIEAGKSLKFLFEVTDEVETDKAPEEGEFTAATRFIGDVQNESVVSDNSEATAATKFFNETQSASEDLSEVTSVTKFASDVAEEDEITSVTKFASDVAEEEEITSVTKFASDVTEEDEITSVTKFASDVAEEEDNAVQDETEMTSVTKFAADLSDEDFSLSDTISALADKTQSGDETQAERTQSPADKTVVKSGSDATESGATVSITEFSVTNSETQLPTSVSFFDKPSSDKASETDPGNDFFGGDDDTADGDDGVFFADDGDDLDKTSSNETQIVQTRMASLDEINFIKSQIKKQQQSRLFFKFLIFSLFVVLLGVIWMLKAPPREKILSWPQKKEGKKTRYLIQYFAPFGGYAKGQFSIYFPEWGNCKVTNANANTFIVQSYLGKNADVPLTLILQREESDEFVYENRKNALANMLRRLSERKDEQFNFDSSPTVEYLVPHRGEGENGLYVEKLAYQRDANGSYFGVLRFFRHAKYNYILRAEVPADEKLRALPILTSDTFLLIHSNFIRRHWEGSDEYNKGDIDRNILAVQDELQRNSAMQYPQIERNLKSLLAQSLYEKKKAPYDKVMALLLNLRDKQQQWYNGQKIRWFSARYEKNRTEMSRIRHDCEAVFSIAGDKRRHDILRDHWE